MQLSDMKAPRVPPPPGAAGCARRAACARPHRRAGERRYRCRRRWRRHSHGRHHARARRPRPPRASRAGPPRRAKHRRHRKPGPPVTTVSIERSEAGAPVAERLSRAVLRGREPGAARELRQQRRPRHAAALARARGAAVRGRHGRQKRGLGRPPDAAPGVGHGGDRRSRPARPRGARRPQRLARPADRSTSATSNRKRRRARRPRRRPRSANGSRGSSSATSPTPTAHQGLREEPWTFLQYDVRGGGLPGGDRSRRARRSRSPVPTSRARARSKPGVWARSSTSRRQLLTGHHYPLSCQDRHAHDRTPAEPPIRALEVRLAAALPVGRRGRRNPVPPGRGQHASPAGAWRASATPSPGALWAAAYVSEAMSIGVAGHQPPRPPDQLLSATRRYARPPAGAAEAGGCRHSRSGTRC